MSYYLRGLLLIVAFCTGCAAVPQNAFLLSPTSLEQRQLQTRLFETSDEVEILSAGISVLQDMGYNIVETEKDVGLITASKNADATDGKQVAAAVFVALMGGGIMPVDRVQKINVSLVTAPSQTRAGYLARVTFQRFVWNNQNQLSRAETIQSPELYQEFFDKLSKSVFLEAYKL